MDDQNKIIEWNNKKTKLKNFNELIKLNKYIDYYNRKNNLTKDVLEVIYSSDYIFEFYNLNNINLIKKMLIRPENLFKLNFVIIDNQMKKYFNRIQFPGLQIIIDFEKAGIIDRYKKISQATYKHDVYIKIEYLCDNNYIEREIGLEYFETVHDRIKDNEKKISSEIQLDSYLIYEEKNKNYHEFMKNTINEIFLSICCVLNDKYILSKIIYFEDYIVNKNIKQDTMIFNKMIEWEKNNEFNFEEFFLSSQPINPDDDKPFKQKEFIKYLKDNYEIEIILDNNNFCHFDYFIEIINVIDIEHCPKIYDYRKTFTNMLKIIIKASDKIIELTNSKSKLIKYNLPMYLDNINLHIPKWKNNQVLKNIYNELKKKFDK